MLCAIHAVVGLGAYYRNLICDCEGSDLLVFRQNYQTSFLYLLTLTAQVCKVRIDKF